MSMNIVITTPAARSALPPGVERTSGQTTVGRARPTSVRNALGPVAGRARSTSRFSKAIQLMQKLRKRHRANQGKKSKTSSWRKVKAKLAQPTSRKRSKRPGSTDLQRSAAQRWGDDTGQDFGFLSDPRLSVAEKLQRLLIELSAKYDAKAEELMKELAGASGNTSGRSAKSASGSSAERATRFAAAQEAFWKKHHRRCGIEKRGLHSMAKKKGKSGDYARSVLAEHAAFAKLCFDNARAARAEARQGTGSSAGQQGTKKNEKVLEFELQRIMQRVNQLFSMAAQLQKSEHDTAKSMIARMAV